MANYGLFLGWNRPIPGREAQAGEIFQQSLGYWSKLQKEGKIESFEPVLINRHGGDLNGFFLVRGDKDKIVRITNSKEYKDLILRVDYNVMGFGAVPVMLGDELASQMKAWMELVTRS